MARRTLAPSLFATSASRLETGAVPASGASASIFIFGKWLKLPVFQTACSSVFQTRSALDTCLSVSST